MLTRVKDYNIFAKLGSSDFIDSGLCVAAAIVFPGARLTADLSFTRVLSESRSLLFTC